MNKKHHPQNYCYSLPSKQLLFWGVAVIFVLFVIVQHWPLVIYFWTFIFYLLSLLFCNHFACNVLLDQTFAFEFILFLGWRMRLKEEERQPMKNMMRMNRNRMRKKEIREGEKLRERRRRGESTVITHWSFYYWCVVIVRDQTT